MPSPSTNATINTLVKHMKEHGGEEIASALATFIMPNKANILTIRGMTLRRLVRALGARIPELVDDTSLPSTAREEMMSVVRSLRRPIGALAAHNRKSTNAFTRSLSNTVPKDHARLVRARLERSYYDRIRLERKRWEKVVAAAIAYDELNQNEFQ